MPPGETKWIIDALTFCPVEQREVDFVMSSRYLAQAMVPFA